MSVCVVIPALNEELAIGGVVRGILPHVDRVIVVDNASSDATAEEASKAGAETTYEPKLGYGRSCLAGIALAGDAEILVFMDGDGADDPSDIDALLAPIYANDADFVVGSRLSGSYEEGALTLPQRFGNWLACFLMRVFWKSPFTDLGPFRAIRAETLQQLDMVAPTYGWTVEMQARAVKQKIRCAEVPVSYRRRIGISKISGTVKGVILAGAYILGVIGREALTPAKPNHDIKKS